MYMQSFNTIEAKLLEVCGTKLLICTQTDRLTQGGKDRLADSKKNLFYWGIKTLWEKEANAGY